MTDIRISNLNDDINKDLTSEVNTLEMIANVFLNMDDNNFMLRHLGNELLLYNKRLQYKLKALTDAVDHMSVSDENIREMIGSANKNLVAEVSHPASYNARPNIRGFLTIPNLSNRVTSASKLWESCLHRSNGRVQSALRSFIACVEQFSGEISGPMMEISSELTSFDYEKGVEELKKMGSYHGRLFELDEDNVKAVHSVIGLVDYVLGKHTRNVQNSIIHSIQRRHVLFLRSIEDANDEI